MATTQEFLNRFLALFPTDSGDIRTRPMMGEYLLYYRGKLVGGLYDDRLLIKNVPAVRCLLPDAELISPYPGAKEQLLLAEPYDPDLLLRGF